MNKLYLNQFFCIILVALILQGCMTMPTDVIMPQWDVALNVPLAIKSYTLDDVMKKAKSSNYISLDTINNVYLINRDEYKQTILISNFIQLNTQSQTPAGTQILVNGPLLEYPFDLPIPKGAQLKTATFAKGLLKIVGHNSSSFVNNLSLRVPGILDAAGHELTLILPIGAGKTDSLIKDLTGYHYQSSVSTQADSKFTIMAKANSTNPLPSLMPFEMYSSNFDFSAFTGYLPQASLGNHSNNFALNLGDAVKYRGNVKLKTGTLTLNGDYLSPTNNPFIVQVNNIKITGKRNNSGQTISLNPLPPLTNTLTFTNGKITQVYSESNSNLLDFITFLPDSIIISADYIMNPGNDPTYRDASNSDFVTFTTNFNTQSNIALSATSFTDTLSFDISQDSRDQISKGQGVTASVDIQNDIPLNANIQVAITDQFYHTLFTIRDTTSTGSVISLKGANPINDKVNTPATSLTTVKLDSSQIKLMANNAYFAIINVTVNTSNVNGVSNLPVFLRPTDWIKLNVFGSVNYRIKGDK